jgi:hypothetical protein
MVVIRVWYICIRLDNTCIIEEHKYLYIYVNIHAHLNMQTYVYMYYIYLCIYMYIQIYVSVAPFFLLRLQNMHPFNFRYIYCCLQLSFHQSIRSRTEPFTSPLNPSIQPNSQQDAVKESLRCKNVNCAESKDSMVILGTLL